MTFTEALASRCLVCDGGMGTQLVARGLKAGDVPELWNVDRAADVAAVHRAYSDAGCDIVTTNTFGCSSVAMARHGLDARCDELNTAAVKLARTAVTPGRFILGDIGPLTQMIEPYGDLTEDDASASFAQQAKSLANAGVDALVIETMSDTNEMTLAIRAARSVCDLPVIATYAFSRAADGTFRTMMGTTAADAMTAAIDAGASVVGANCGTSLSLPDYADLARVVLEAAGRTPVIIQPNAGSPKLIDGNYTYDATPQAMAELAQELQRAGVRIIGGCCGTTPAHLKAMAAEIRRKGG
jgi:methionine synthase I (cobalamin-dependent)